MKVEILHPSVLHTEGQYTEVILRLRIGMFSQVCVLRGSLWRLRLHLVGMTSLRRVQMPFCIML